MNIYKQGKKIYIFSEEGFVFNLYKSLPVRFVYDGTYYTLFFIILALLGRKLWFLF